jgi:acetyl esterase
MTSLPSFPGVVDPEMQACWTAQPAWGAAINAVWCKDLAMMRLLFNEGRKYWNDGTPALPRVIDLTLPRPDRGVPLRIYDPVGGGQPRPALVFLHGGGYVVGTLDTHDVICREFALASGMIVVNVDYALAPEFKFPRAIDETIAVGRFLRALGHEWGIDGGRLALGGDSAGAAMSMAALTWLRDRGEMLFSAGWCVYGAYGAEDTASRRAYSGEAWGLTPAYRDFYRAAYYRDPADAQDIRANVLRAIDFKGLPPIFLAPAELDPLRDDSMVLADRLAADGVPVRLEVYLGVLHGFLHMTKRLGAARRAVADGATWLKQVLA